MSDHELTPDERLRLLEAVAVEVPDGFADRVMDAAILESRATNRGRARGRRRLVGVAVLLAAALVLLLTQAWALALPTGADASLIASRTAATSSLQSHCGTCHDGARASAEPAAVRAFDLSRADWSTTLADEDLRGLVDRIDARGDVPRGDRAQVASFVAAELRARRG